ncbi:polysaccharide biosynthesis protein [Pseudomonadales bacterium]|nr:polysaccharide biosynthesis protein [Pseudomonadales bacterium]
MIKNYGKLLQGFVLTAVTAILFGVAGLLAIAIASVALPRVYLSWRDSNLVVKIAIKMIGDFLILLALLAIFFNEMDWTAKTIFCLTFVLAGWLLGVYRTSTLDLTIATVNKTFTSAVVAYVALFFYNLIRSQHLPYLDPVTFLQVDLSNSRQLLALLFPMMLLPIKALIAFFAESPKADARFNQPIEVLFVYFSSKLGNGDLKLYKDLIESNGYRVGLIVDSSQETDRYIEGTKVTGLTKLDRILKKRPYEEAILMQTSPDQIHLVSECRDVLKRRGVRISKLDDLSSNRVKATLSPRELASSWTDLLRVPKQDFDLPRTTRYPLDSRIVISGGAGSIGAKIVEVLLENGFLQVHVVDASELGLYALTEKYADAISNHNLTLHLSDIKEYSSLKNTILSINPDLIFHAAAYKHVHISEDNHEIVYQTNVVGTHNLLRIMRLCSCQHFTLVSTDKAVYPTNFMGASKRLAELLVEKTANADKTKDYTVVRFGNVMGSSGSALLKFAEQISYGNKLTLTHPDMERYFMSIEQAAYLVMQSAVSLKLNRNSNFQCYVLDMGKPQKILDVMKLLIELSGKKLVDKATDPNHIEIQVTGLRPGEKLYEELSHSGNVTPTELTAINRFDTGIISGEDVREEFSKVFLNKKQALNDVLVNFETLKAYEP